MIFGVATVVIGYAIFYWGLHHMKWYSGSRYSLWCLLGVGSLFKNVQLSTEAMAGMASGEGGTGATQQQNPSNTQTPNNLGFRSPVSSGLSWGRTDQGVDFGGSGPLYAVGSGTVVMVRTTGSGWPGLGTSGSGAFIVLKLDNPQGLPSPDIYYAEDIQPAVKVGDHVNAGDVIGNATGGRTGIELGFADPNALGKALGWSWGAPFKTFIQGLK